jgi:hypothetical protein
MKLVVLLLLVTVPAQAQDKKWIGLGGILGGAGLAIVGATHKETETITRTTMLPDCVVGGTANATGVACASPAGSITTTEQRRNTNWKLIGPAIGLAGAGAVLFKVGRTQVSVRQGGIRVAFKW